jgi:hypothetical protein
MEGLQQEQVGLRYFVLRQRAGDGCHDSDVWLPNPIRERRAHW